MNVGDAATVGVVHRNEVTGWAHDPEISLVVLGVVGGGEDCVWEVKEALEESHLLVEGLLVDHLHRLQVCNVQVLIRTHSYYRLLSVDFHQACSDYLFTLASLHLEVALLLLIDDDVRIFGLILSSRNYVGKFTVDFGAIKLLSPAVARWLLRNVQVRLSHLVWMHEPALALLVVVAVDSVLAWGLDLMPAVALARLLALRGLLLHLVGLTRVVIHIIEDILYVNSVWLAYVLEFAVRSVPAPLRRVEILAESWLLVATMVAKSSLLELVWLTTLAHWVLRLLGKLARMMSASASTTSAAIASSMVLLAEVLLSEILIHF